MLRTLITCLCYLFAAPLAAHEFWIEAQPWQVQPDAPVAATLHNGQEFEGSEIAYFDRRIARFGRLHDGAIVDYEGRNGDNPAFQADTLPEGLHVLAYESAPQRVTYDDFEAFARFGDHKDLGPFRTLHANRGLPEADFVEAYTRFAKALIAVGDGAGVDRAVGLDHEFVALDNPYTDDLSDGMRLQLFRFGAPRGDAQVELFRRAEDGSVEITLHRTDENGIVTLSVEPGYEYLADAVILFEPSEAMAEASGAVWETDWAALTWAVP